MMIPNFKPLQHLSLFALINLSACDLFAQQEIDVAPNSTTDVTLRRTFQHIRRYNCAGVLITDRVEEIARANALIYVHPSSQSESQIYRSQFSNRTTGESGGATRGGIGLYIDISPSSLAMHVREGSNTIFYHYTQCLKRSIEAESGMEVCDDERTLEDGTIQINVTFIQETLAGVRDEHDFCPTPVVPSEALPK